MTDDEAIRKSLIFGIAQRQVSTFSFKALYTRYHSSSTVFTLVTIIRLLFFGATSVALLATAIKMDNAYEDEMLVVVKAHIEKADSAARLLGLSK